MLNIKINQPSNDIPESVEEIVDQVISELSLEDRLNIANLEDREISIINTLMTDYIQSKLNEWSIKHAKANLAEPETVVKEIWIKLRKTHKLKIIK